MTDRTEQEKIERLLTLCGLHRCHEYSCYWHDASGRCLGPLNPFTSHDDCVPLFAEIERRGLKWALYRTLLETQHWAEDEHKSVVAWQALNLTPAVKADTCLRVLEADEQTRKEKG